MTVSGWLIAARSFPLDRAALALGYTVRGGRLGPCPACRVEVEPKIRRLPAGIYRADLDGRERWTCNVCKARGDVVDLVVASYGSMSGARAWFEGTGDVVSVAPRPSTVSAPVYPPEAELRAVLRAAQPIARTSRRDILEWCESRAIDPKRAPLWIAEPSFDYDSLSVGRSTQVERPRSWWPRGRARAYPILLPMYDSLGRLRGLRGRRISGDGPKTLAPSGFDSKGLVMADPWIALPLLRQEAVSASTILFVEGDTDFASAAQARIAGVIGVISGSTPALIGLRPPASARLISVMDLGAAGDRYHAGIVAAVAPHPVYRAPLGALARS